MAKRIIIIGDQKEELTSTCKSLSELKYIAFTLNADNFTITEFIASDPALVLIYVESLADKEYDLLLDIRANFFTSRLPVILITSDPDVNKTFEDDTKIYGFVEPFDQGSLIDQINELLMAKIIPLYQVVGGGMFLV